MTMSTYKSLGGPPSGLLVTNDAEVARRVDAIAYPGLTANFDAGKTAALAISLLDWKRDGAAYAREMTDAASALASELEARSLPVFGGGTKSHAFAVDAGDLGGGHTAAVRLRESNLLTSAIGLPTDAPTSPAGGLRIGLNEAVRWGLTAADMPELADLVARGLDDGGPAVGTEVTAFRGRFRDLHFMTT